MLKITIPAKEIYDESTNTFTETKETTLQLEHSLLSLSRWESKWEKPFLDDKIEKTNEMMLDYIRCMTINSTVDPNVYKIIGQKELSEISKYINAKMTATWFTEDEHKKMIGTRGRGGTTITSEVIYYLMVAYQIPFECQKWHLNRLITLIRVCEEKNKQPEKMSKGQIMERNRKLNEARRKALGSKG